MPTQLTVMVFPGTQTLPLFAAQANGFFAKRGLAIELKPAPNSEEQRKGLAEGRYQIVHGAADQCVALVEGTNFVRRELGLPEARVRAADPKLWFAEREPIR